MKVFVWEDVDQVSNREHSYGGVVVFAADELEARMLANVGDCMIRPDEHPCYVRECLGDDKRVFIFPNAGCC